MIRLCILFVFFSANVFGMVECQRLKEILPLVSENTLVVFNINNVLTVSQQDAGSTPWAEEHIAQIGAANNITKPHATNLFIPLWHDILIASDVELFDPEAESIVRHLQSNNIKVMALTNRYVEMGYPTHRQLRSVGIDFAKNPPYPEDFFIQGISSPAKYIEGIIFNGLINFKGDSLVAFLKQINYFPEKIIYIEDKPKHLAQVEKAVTELGIAFVGVHFGALDLQRQSYQKELADLQVQYHFDILDDQSALKLYNRFQDTPLMPSDKKTILLPKNVQLINSFKELEKDLIPNALVVTELDHVLWQTTGTIGSRTFLKHLEDKYRLLGYSPKVSMEKAARVCEKIHRRAQVRIIDDESKAFINNLSQNNCWSVALSYRPYRLLDRTEEQIDQLDLQFNSPFISSNSLHGQQIFCDSGFEELRKQIANMEKSPAVIIGISSELSDLTSLQDIANDLHINFKGYFYTSNKVREDLLVDEILNIELELIDRLLTNDEASFLIYGK